MQVDNSTTVKFLERMLKIRITEETIAERYSEWKMRCPTHLSTGQEAVATGICSALRKDDFVLKYLYDNFDIKSDIFLDKDKILNSYLYTALWTAELESDFSIEDGDEDFIVNAKKDIELFVDLSGHLLAGVAEDDIGHDLWLTRNGHGAGFWDGDYPEAGKELDKIASKMGGKDIYVGDDGKLYID